MRSSVPFKNKRKLVVERAISGERTRLVKRGGVVRFEPETEVDTRVAGVIADEPFVLRGVVHDQKMYADDLLSFGARSFENEPWHERFRHLKKKFSWNSAVHINRPLVVTSEDELMEAAKMFKQFDDSEGVMVREYDQKPSEDQTMVPLNFE